MTACPYGFWVRGSKHAGREPVRAADAFAGFAACDPAARPDAEHYLSAFTYGDDFLAYLKTTGSTAQFAGPCCALWVWFDIDRGDDIDAALADARALSLHLEDGWGIAAETILVFLSGKKGFHIGVPTALWGPAPSTDFHEVAHRFALALARGAGGRGVVIDGSVYGKVQLFRAPNSRHPATGLRKRRLTSDELLHLSIERIVGLAREPVAFDVPAPAARNEKLSAAWEQAAAAIAAEKAAMQERRAATGGAARLNALTLDFIREGAEEGGDGTADDAGRHRRLYAAAINLGEFGCPAPLAHALLTNAALDCGITPGEARRTIDNGLRNAGKEPPNV